MNPIVRLKLPLSKVDLILSLIDLGRRQTPSLDQAKEFIGLYDDIQDQTLEIRDEIEAYKEDMRNQRDQVSKMSELK